MCVDYFSNSKYAFYTMITENSLFHTRTHLITQIRGNLKSMADCQAEGCRSYLPGSCLPRTLLEDLSAIILLTRGKPWGFSVDMHFPLRDKLTAP
jgi:hypothetical protein